MNPKLQRLLDQFAISTSFQRWNTALRQLFRRPAPDRGEYQPIMADLTIRNLTATPLELKLVERVEGPPRPGFTRKIMGIFQASSPAAHGESRDRQDVAIPIAPFETRTTGVRTVDVEGREKVYLTLESSNGRRYQIQIPTASTRSVVMKMLPPPGSEDGVESGEGSDDENDSSNGNGRETTVNGSADAEPAIDAANSTIPSKPEPREQYTAVYMHSGSCLCILSSAKLHQWMSKLPDAFPLTALSIPGTHNSPTYFKALPSVRCQAVGLREQLRNGVRFFDIRVSASPKNDELTLVHSVFPISLTGTKSFQKHLLDRVYAFLAANPTETLLMSIKREGTGKGTDHQMSRYLRSRYCADPAKWYTDPRVPRLGEARGKIVLLRRYANDPALDREHDGRGFGLDMSAWPDNCADETTGGPGLARVQDFYEIELSSNIEKKIDFVRSHLERASEPVCAPGVSAHAHHNHNNDNNNNNNNNNKGHNPFFVNFLTASNFFRTTCWPEKIAFKVNPATIEYLCLRHGEHGKGPGGLDVGDAGTGIVVTDWVGLGGDWDLVRCVVAWNARLQLKR